MSPQIISLNDIPVNPKTRYFRLREKGAAVRASVVFEDPNNMMVGARCHWDSKLGYFECKSDVCCQVGPPRWRVGVPLFVYDRSKQDGSLFKWVMGEGAYSNLSKVHSEFNLAEHDLGIICEHPDYARYDIRTASQILWKKWDRADSILSSANQILSDLKRCIAKDLSLSTIRSHLGIGKPKKRDKTFQAPNAIFQAPNEPFQAVAKGRRIQWL